MPQHRSATPIRWLIALELAALLGGALLFGVISSVTSPQVYGKDLLQDYVAARALAAGDNPYLPTSVLAVRYEPLALAAAAYPTPHPPTALLLFVPFTWIGFPITVEIWLATELIALTLSLWLLCRYLGFRWPIWAILVGAVALVDWYPVAEDIGIGQLMLPLLALLVGSYLALIRNRSILSGALLGVALLIKPIPWPILFLFVVKRDWQALWGAIIPLALGYGAAIAVLGPNRVVGYFLQVLPAVSGGFHQLSRNLSLWTIGWRLFAGTSTTAFGRPYFGTIAAPPLVDSPAVAPLLGVLLPAVALVVTFWLVRRQASVDLAFGLVVCASVAVSPTFWNCYLVLLAIPIAAIVKRLVASGFPRRPTEILVATLVPSLLPFSVLASGVMALSTVFEAGGPPNSVTTLVALGTLLPTVGLIGIAGLADRVGRTNLVA